MTEAVEYLDVTLVDTVHRSRRFFNDNDKTVTEQERRDEIPEDLMSKLENYLGDGQARVTVSGALSSSHEFHKAESFVSISVSCHNDLDNIRDVHDLVRPHVAELVHADHDEMSLLRDKILPVGKKLHTDLDGPTKVASPPKSKAAPKGLPPAKVAAPPKSNLKTRKGVKRPSFTR